MIYWHPVLVVNKLATYINYLAIIIITCTITTLLATYISIVCQNLELLNSYSKDKILKSYMQWLGQKVLP